MPKLAKYCSIFAAILLIIFAVGIFVASNMFDSKIYSVIKQINNRQNYVVFNYTPKTNSLLTKNGRLEVLIPNTPLGDIQSFFDVTVDLSFTSFKVNLKKLDHEGNLDRLISSMNLPIFKLQGAFAFYPWQLKLSGAFKTSSFSLPLEDGECRFGENSLFVSGRSQSSIKVEFASAGVKCLGFKKYNGKEAYNFSFLDFAVKALPQLDIKNKKLSLDSLSVNFNNLDFDASTIYLIGFEPEDKVKDNSLRDRFKVNNFSVNLAISDKDSHNRRTISSDGVLNINFALPYIKEGQIQPYYDLSNIKYNFSIDAIDIDNMLKALKSHDDNLIVKLVSSLSKPLNVELKNFSFEHENHEVLTDGLAKVILDGNSGKLKDIDAKLNAKADREFVDPLLFKQYEDSLLDLLENKSVVLSKGVYSTTLRLNGKEFTLNGHPLSIEENPQDKNSDDDALTLDGK